MNSFHPIHLVAAFLLSRTDVSLKHSISLRLHTSAILERHYTYCRCTVDPNTLTGFVTLYETGSCTTRFVICQFCSKDDFHWLIARGFSLTISHQSRGDYR